MPELNQFDCSILTFDARLSPDMVSRRRIGAEAYTLWDENPFGWSVDTDVWPSLFTTKSDRTSEDLIPMAEGEVPYWDAFRSWHSVSAMIAHLLPTEHGGKLIAIGIDRDSPTIRKDSTLDALVSGPPPQAELNISATLVGYDVADAWMISFLFNTALGDARKRLSDLAGARTSAGLLAELSAARAVRDELNKIEQAHFPLYIYFVFELGDAPVGVTR